jgi:predicted nucleic acid-binding protein
LRGNTALDAGALIEYLTGTALGRVLREYFDHMEANETAYTSTLTVAETFYVLCRRDGLESAHQKLTQMIASNMIQPIGSIEMTLEMGKLKCERAISLPDCSCLAAAKETRARAVFALREAELTREMKRKPFDVDIIFLEDMVSS